MNRFHFLVTALHKNTEFTKQVKEEFNVRNKLAKVLNDDNYKFIIADENAIDDKLNEFESLDEENKKLKMEIAEVDCCNKSLIREIEQLKEKVELWKDRYLDAEGRLGIFVNDLKQLNKKFD